jgi:hypothetical protein
MGMSAVSYKAGFDVEDRVINILKAYDCKLDCGDEGLDHNHKLDFILQRLPENPAYVTTGVQITLNLDNAFKMNEFFEINHRIPVTPRAVYMELGDGVDLERGGGLAVLLALGDFALNRKMRSEKIGGVRIHSDMTYEFFNLEEKIKELRKPVFKTAPVVSPVVTPKPVTQAAVVSAVSAAQQISNSLKTNIAGTMAGVLDHWISGDGYGFIIGQSGDSYFIHRNFLGTELQTKLDAMDKFGGDHHDGVYHDLGIEVRFRDIGVTKPGVKRPEARDVIPLV